MPIVEELFLAATEAGAEDFEAADEFYIIITTDPLNLFAVRDAINHLGFKVDEAEIEMIPKNLIETDLETAKANLALIEWLENLDDVDAVYHNMKIPDEK